MKPGRVAKLITEEKDRSIKRRSALLSQGQIGNKSSLDLNEESEGSFQSITSKLPFELHVPPGLSPKRISKDPGIKETHNANERLLGLPGSLSLDQSTTSKYFGDNARNKFFNRYQWLNHQRSITSLSQDGRLERLFFENEKDDPSKHVPFAPVRSHNPEDHLHSVEVVEADTIQKKSFQDRFRSFSSEASEENESRRLRESAMRSGIRGEDFDDDMLNSDDLFIGEMGTSSSRKNSHKDGVGGVKTIRRKMSLAEFIGNTDDPELLETATSFDVIEREDENGNIQDVKIRPKSPLPAANGNSGPSQTTIITGGGRPPLFRGDSLRSLGRQPKPLQQVISESIKYRVAKSRYEEETAMILSARARKSGDEGEASPAGVAIGSAGAVRSPGAGAGLQNQLGLQRIIDKEGAEDSEESDSDSSSGSSSSGSTLSSESTHSSKPTHATISAATAGENGADRASPMGKLTRSNTAPTRPLSSPMRASSSAGKRNSMPLALPLLPVSENATGTPSTSGAVCRPATSTIKPAMKRGLTQGIGASRGGGGGGLGATKRVSIDLRGGHGSPSSSSKSTGIKSKGKGEVDGGGGGGQALPVESGGAEAETGGKSVIAEQQQQPKHGKQSSHHSSNKKKKEQQQQQQGKSKGKKGQPPIVPKQQGFKGSQAVKELDSSRYAPGGGTLQSRLSRSGRLASVPGEVYSDMILADLLNKKKFKYIPGEDGVEEEDDMSGLDGHGEKGARANRQCDEESVATQSTVTSLDFGLFLSGLSSGGGAKPAGNDDGAQRQDSQRSNSVSGRLPFITGDCSRGPITSPRTTYLTGCMQERLNPRASLLLRRNFTKELNLQHHGMGDAMAQLLAESLRGIPYIQSINIMDNMLTDVGMGPIIMSAMGIPGLLELNLSQNEIGPVSARALFDYLQSETCPLQRLILKSADVDDFECERFVEAIKLNKSLKELDLASNKIGSAENLNTVMPDLVTGGEAIAELLRLPECNLTKLNLEWNMLRLDGAIDLAKAISINTTLKHLDLSYNSLSTEGGITLGMSILKNKVLETLVIVNNSIDSMACFTICAAIVENRGLKKVVLDGNPIGEQGMKAMMLVPMIAGNRVKVSAARCNTNIKDPRCWFSFEKLIRDYTLNMESGFERAIAMVLLHLIAGHHSFIFSKYEHELPPAKGRGAPRRRNIELVQVASTERSNYFDSRQTEVLQGLLKIKAAASDIATAIKLFQEVDEDGSGELDIDELAVLMGKMGLVLTPKRLHELMNQYDVDQGGKIEIHEFLMMLKSLNKEAAGRIKELVESPIMALKSDTSGKQYLPPETGVLNITVTDGFARKPRYRIMSSCDREYINEIAEEMSGAVAAEMIESSLNGTKLRLDEGLAVAETILLETQDKVATVRKLIVQMNDTNDARHLIESLLEGDRQEMLRLKREFGSNALRPIIGNPNGYYVLDMSKQMDRLCLEKLLEISTTSAVHRQQISKLHYGRVGDLSQKGNWSSFRNELLNGEPVTITPSFAQPFPLSGKIEFDFITSDRPGRDVMVLSDIRVVKVLLAHFLLRPKDCAIVLYKLNWLTTQLDRTLDCDGVTFYECPMDRARMIAEHVEHFYENLHLRSRHHAETNEKESSTLVDASGELLRLFEPEKGFIPTKISDFMENPGRVGPLTAEEAVQADQAPATFTPRGGRRTTTSEKLASGAKKGGKNRGDRRKSKRPGAGAGAGGGGGNTKRGASGKGGKGGAAAISDGDDSESSESSSSSSSSSDDSDDDDDDDDIGFAAQYNDDVMPHMASLASLKVSNTESLNEDDAEQQKVLSSDGDPTGEAAAEMTEEEMDWQKQLQLMSAAYKPKVVEHAKVDVNKRKNVGMVQEDFLDLPPPDEFMEKFKALLESTQINVGAKARRVIDMLEDVFARSWILSRHLAIIVEVFSLKYGFYKQTKFHGSYRVELIIALFNRVIDLHNFECVLRVLLPKEVAALYCRVGWLNLYNPCKPEGSWELDLSRREERVLGKTLCCLATNEPGDNWVIGTFRWMRSMDPMPGWELTQPWLTEEGMPMRGLLNVAYYSGEGKRKRGCRPYISFRKSLLNLVLIREEEIVSEGLRGKPPPAQQPGDKAFQKHIGLWDQYLTPANVDPKRKR